MIKKEQFWVGVLGTGPAGRQLSSSFQRRDEKEYHIELGDTIIKACGMVPGGVLVFFPSYGAKAFASPWGLACLRYLARSLTDRVERFLAGVMETCVKSWKSSNIWQRLQAVKPTLEEPRQSSDLKVRVTARGGDLHIRLRSCCG